MAEFNESAPRIAILWRGERTDPAPTPRSDRQLEPLLAALGRQGATVVLTPYADDAADEVREELLGCDGVLVWVNPIQDRATRRVLDPVLRDVAAREVYVSAHPDVVARIGTKEVLYRTRALGWGSDTQLYGSFAELVDIFPARLAAHGRLVVKQARGNGGQGVWRVDTIEARDVEDPSGTRVRVYDAQSPDGAAETVDLADFLTVCEECFAWSGTLVDQEYQERLAEGMVRCYFSHDELVGYARQYPSGLLDSEARARRGEMPRAPMEDPERPEYQALRARCENEWVPEMMSTLGLRREDLPVIWDADFLFGARNPQGEDTFVLCEINASAVWPFPTAATETVARAALERTLAARALRRHDT